MVYVVVQRLRDDAPAYAEYMDVFARWITAASEIECVREREALLAELRRTWGEIQRETAMLKEDHPKRPIGDSVFQLASDRLTKYGVHLAAPSVRGIYRSVRSHLKSGGRLKEPLLVAVLERKDSDEEPGGT